MPASIELEYDVPADSDAVKEVVKCLHYCKAALANPWAGGISRGVQPARRSADKRSPKIVPRSSG